jgi:hypothetical protein
MSPRRLLRIVLSLLIIVLLWMRVLRDWRYESRLWLTGSLTLSVILLTVVIAEVSGVLRKRRRPQDEVPKRPLGLDT